MPFPLQPMTVKKRRLLIVCTANICRSPVAAVLLNHELRQQGLRRRYVAESAGTQATQPVAMDPRMRMLAQEAGVKVGRHRARQVTAELLDRCERVYVMEPSHAAAIDSLSCGAPGSPPAVQLLHRAGAPIADPYFEDMDVVQTCFTLLWSEVAQVASRLREGHNREQ